MERCPFCVKLEGAMKMHLGSSAQGVYNKNVCYHDADTQHGMQSWEEEVGSVVPAGYNTVPRIVAEYSDGSLLWIGGFDDFVRKLGKARRK